MKNSKLLKGISIAALLMVTFTGNIKAQQTPAYYTIPANSSISLVVCPGYSTNNPNSYPVVSFNGGGAWGFLLDGSELRATWLKMLQDALTSGKEMVIGFDDNTANGYSAECVPTSGVGNLKRVYSIRVYR